MINREKNTINNLHILNYLIIIIKIKKNKKYSQIGIRKHILKEIFLVIQFQILVRSKEHYIILMFWQNVKIKNSRFMQPIILIAFFLLI